MTAPTFSPLFFPEANQAADEFDRNDSLLAYYTTAETALKILKNKELWMRNVRVMNDPQEVEHGLRCLQIAYESAEGQKLKAALDQAHPGISDEIEAQYNKWRLHFQFDSYIACFSTHTAVDDAYGRLSMWRAYGGSSGVAFILNPGVLLRPSSALAAYSSPVAYLDMEMTRQKIGLLAESIAAESAMLRTMPREELKTNMFNVFRYAALSIKHPAFAEEREWRVVATPELQRSPAVKYEQECLAGTPQRVLKIQLADIPEQGLIGLDPDSFIQRILIGPSEHPVMVAQAIIDAARSAGISNPDRRVHHTNIPLRTAHR